MTSKQLVAIALLGLFLSLPLQAFVISIHIWKLPKEGGGALTYLVLGDNHKANPQKDEERADEEHKRLILGALEKGKSDKLTVLIESNQAEFDSSERILKRLPVLTPVSAIQALRRFITKHDGKYGQISFISADLRTDAIRYFLDFVPIFNNDYKGLADFNAVNMPRSANDLIGELTDHLQFLRTAKERSCESKSPLCDTLTLYVTKLNAVLALTETYGSAVLGSLDEPSIDILRKCTDYEKGKLEADFKAKVAKKELGPNEASTWYDNEVLRRMEERDEKVSSIYNTLFWDLSDAGFLAALEAHKNDADNMLIFLGDAHAEKINVHFRELKAENVLALSNPKFVSSKELDAAFAKAFGTIGAEAKECCVCHKSEVTLSLCGRCKTVLYCSKGCQNTDWPKHKLVCKTAEKEPTK